MEPQSLAAQQFTAALEALDALNSFVRSEAYRNGCGILSGLPKAVYQYKDWALDKLSDFYEVKRRYLQLLANCRRCHQGTYYDDYGEKRGECWTCHGTGHIRLAFTEYRFDRFSWHRPMQSLSEVPPYALLELETDWQPNQPGKDLTPDEAVTHLNTVETYFFAAITPHVRFDHESRFLYRLFVGDKPQACSFCHGEPMDLRYCVSRDGISWHDWACEPCRKEWEQRWGTGQTSIFDHFALPGMLMTDVIRQWQERHREWEGLRKKEDRRR